MPPRGRGRGRGAARGGRSATPPPAEKRTRGDAGDDADDVTLLYRKPRRGGSSFQSRRVAPTASFVVSGMASSSGSRGGGAAPHADGRAVNPTLSSTTDEMSGLLHFSGKGPAELKFWWRCADVSHLGTSLANSGAALREVGSGDGAGQQQQQQHPLLNAAPTLFSLGEDRLRTAMQAIVDLKALLRRKEGSLGCWIARTHFTAAVSLAALCEAAVPTLQPPLVSADALAHAPSRQGDDPLVPAPVSLEGVLARQQCLRRVWQLRFAYSMIAPLVRQCVSAEDISTILFSSTTTSGSHFRPLATIASRHRVEQQVLTGLVEQANKMCAPDTKAWGMLAQQLPLLRISDGVYLTHADSRRAALQALLREEAELYGLPPFLRSIRGGAAWGSGGGGVTAPPAKHNKIGGGQSSTASYSSFFLSPEFLDAKEFALPDSVQAPIVQEEIINISLKHSAFGLVVGEADQILYLVKAWGEHDAMRRAKQTKSEAMGENPDGTVKPELTDEEEENERDARKAYRLGRDPMATFVRETAARAKSVRMQQQLDDRSATSPSWAAVSGVHWLCSNRWSPDTTYYALTFTVVLSSDFGEEGITPQAPLDADANTNTHRAPLPQFREVTYSLNTVLELSR